MKKRVLRNVAAFLAFLVVLFSVMAMFPSSVARAQSSPPPYTATQYVNPESISGRLCGVDAQGRAWLAAGSRGVAYTNGNTLSVAVSQSDANFVACTVGDDGWVYAVYRDVYSSLSLMKIDPSNPANRSVVLDRLSWVYGYAVRWGDMIKIPQKNLWVLRFYFEDYEDVYHLVVMNKNEPGYVGSGIYVANGGSATSTPPELFYYQDYVYYANATELVRMNLKNTQVSTLRNTGLNGIETYYYNPQSDVFYWQQSLPVNPNLSPATYPSFMRPTPDGGLIILGNFTSLNGNPNIRYLAKYAGGQWQPLVPSQINSVYIAPFVVGQDGSIFFWSTHTSLVKLSPPILTTVTKNPSSGWAKTVAVTIQYGGTVSNYSLRYRLNGGDWVSTTSNPATMTVSENGSIEYEVYSGAVRLESGSTSITNVDNLPPSASISVPNPDGLNGWHTGNVSASVSGDDPAPGSGVAISQIRINGGAWETSPKTISSDGVYTVEGRVIDNAGNVSVVVTATVKRDSTPPLASLNVPTPDGNNGWFVSRPTVSTSGQDATSGVLSNQMRVNGGVWQEGEITLSDGVFNIEGRSRDNAGLWSGVTSATVKVDSVSPQVAVSLPPVNGKNGWYVGDILASVQAEDAISGVVERSIQINGGDWQPNNWLITVDGIHTITVRAADVAGNINTAAVIVKRDGVPPRIVPQLEGASIQDGWYGGEVVVSATVEDDVSGVSRLRAKINGGEWRDLPFTVVSDGDYVITYEAEDNAGNISTHTVSFQIDTLRPSPPVNLTVAGGDNRCSDASSYLISWQPPSNLRLPINYYEILFNGRVVRSEEFSYTVENLPFGQHRLGVRAVNQNGASDWSEIVLCRSSFSVRAEATQSNTYTMNLDNRELSLTISPSAIYGQPTDFLIYPSTDNTGLPQDKQVVMPPTIFEAYRLADGERVTVFGEPLLVRYQVANEIAMGIAPARLSFYYRDPQDGWIKIPSTVDVASGWLSAYLEHFSEYAVLLDGLSTHQDVAHADLNILGLLPLSVQTAPLDFGSHPLTGFTISVDASPSPWLVVDPTGTGSGWHVTLSASDFVSQEQHRIDIHNLLMMTSTDGVQKVYGNNPPQITTSGWVVLSPDAVKVLSANEREGMGTYRWSPDFRLIVPANTYAGKYSATLTVSIISSP